MQYQNRLPRFVMNKKKGLTTITMLKVTLVFLLIVLAGVVIAIGTHLGSNKKTGKADLFGAWIEVGAPKYNTDTYVINGSGVYKNSRLLTTNYQFDGTELIVETGGGRYVYVLSAMTPLNLSGHILGCPNSN